MADEQVDELVRADRNWLEHILDADSPKSHRMFTEQSYHYSFWQNAEHSIVLIDEDGNIITANPRFLTLTGNTLPELQECNFFDMIDRKHFRRDQANIEAIIDSNIYSYVSKTKILGKNSKKDYIPVKVVATRVPSTLNHPFRHIVIHLYEMPDKRVVKNSEVTDMEPFEWKRLFTQVWFVKMCFWLVGLLAILISLSGHLHPILEKIMEKL